MCQQPQQRYACTHNFFSSPIIPCQKATCLNPKEPNPSKHKYQPCLVITYPTHFIHRDCAECAAKAEEERRADQREYLKLHSEGKIKPVDYNGKKAEQEVKEWKKSQNERYYY